MARPPTNTPAAEPQSPADVPLWMDATASEHAPALAFDFPLLYPMHGPAGPVLFTEDAGLATALRLSEVVAVPKAGKAIPGYGAASVELAVLGLRVRWSHPDHPRVLTAHLEYPGQRSRAQLLCVTMDGTPLTVVARSTATDALRKALALAARASTRALVASRGKLRAPPPLWTWRLSFAAASGQAVSRAGVAYTSRTIQASYAAPVTDLDALCVPRDVADSATLLWGALGEAWLAAWAEAPDTEAEAEPDEDPAPGAPDAVARRAGLLQAAAEAEARWDEQAAVARRLADPTGGGRL